MECHLFWNPFFFFFSLQEEGKHSFFNDKCQRKGIFLLWNALKKHIETPFLRMWIILVRPILVLRTIYIFGLKYFKNHQNKIIEELT